MPVQYLVWLLGGSHIVAVLRNCAVQVWDVAARKLVGSLDSTWTMAGITYASAHPPHQCKPSSNNSMRGGKKKKQQQGGMGPPPPAYMYLGGDNGTVYVIKVLPQCQACVGYTVSRGDATGVNREREREQQALAAAGGGGLGRGKHDTISPLDANNTLNDDDEGVEDEVVALSVCPSHAGGADSKEGMGWDGGGLRKVNSARCCLNPGLGFVQLFL